MPYGERGRGPFGLDAPNGQTVRYQRTVLAVAHSVTTAARLADVLPLLERDRRVQVMYTCAPSSVFAEEATDYLRRMGGVVVPWQQATAGARFDLAVAASHGSLEQLHAPVLVVPHGVGFGKLPRVCTGAGPVARRELAQAGRGPLIHHGRVVAAGIVVATTGQRDRLIRSCPQAAEVAVVAGDPCLDRLVASKPLRGEYRRALGTGQRSLVVVSSTWGPESVLAQYPDLLPRLLRELPPGEYQVAAITHPNVWHWHSRRQVSAWFGDGTRDGLILVPPGEGWRAVVTAGDVLIGDRGSVTCYAAAAGVPVVFAIYPGGEPGPRSRVTSLARAAPRLRPEEPLEPQLSAAAMAWSPHRHRRVHASFTSEPGQSAAIIREVMYRLMRLPEPATPPETRPVPVFGQPVGAARK
jgi:hypothetical protein